MNVSSDLANAVSAFATTLAGLIPFVLSLILGGHPRRWLFVYVCIFITGIATVWYHGFGEEFIPGIADIGTNLLVVWALQFAVLGDYYSRRTHTRIAIISGAIILAFSVWKFAVGPASSRIFPLTFGNFGGFNPGEILLIANSVFAVGLLYVRHAQIPPRARPVWYLVTAIFFVGALLATASNQRVDFVVLAYHATWHIVAAFGFVVLWVFNYVRFA